MRNPNHPIFRPSHPAEDSCLAAVHVANERYLRRRQAAQEREVKQEQAGPYVATDDDLAEIFWSEGIMRTGGETQ
jgi:hypothetical protein